MISIKYWALSRCGTRAENEDACLIPNAGLIAEDTLESGSCILSGNGEIFAIADGVGGGPDGKLAAITALQNLAAEKMINNDVSHLEKRLKTADSAVQKLRSERGRPATTVAGLSVSIKTTHVFNLGDTRVYDLSDRGILTEDHRSTLNRSAITRFLGGGPAQAVSKISTLQTTPRKLLICSDGLYNFVSTATLALLTDRDPGSELPRLFDAAEGYGSNDNMTAIFCEID